MGEYKHIIGEAIVALTFLSMIISVYGVYLRFRGVLNSKTKVICDTQFKLLMLNAVVGVVGGTGCYTAIKTWIENPDMVLDEIVVYRLLMWVGVFVLSVLSLLLGSRFNPFREE